MSAPVLTRADRLSRAVADGDDWAVERTLESLSKTDLRNLVVELAGRAGPSDTDAEIVEATISHASHIFGAVREDVLAGSRRREATEARQVACYASRLLGCSYPVIGRQIGRDHSTVMHACARVGEVPRLRTAGQRIATRLGWDRNTQEDIA